VLILYFLILKIVQTLTEESNPSSNLVAAVKHLYKSKLKVCLISDCCGLLQIVFAFNLLHFLMYAKSFLSWQDASILIPLLSSFPKEEVLYACIILMYILPV
jgi:hypothetical protein